MPKPVPSPKEKDIGQRVADRLRKAVGLGSGAAGRGQGTMGQSKRRSIDAEVDAAVTGRQRKGQHTDSNNGY